MSQQNIQNLVDNITYLNTTKQLIKNAIINKGQEITATTPFRNYVEKISNITTGDSSDSYLFTNLTEMNSFTANEGDYGIIWYEKAEGVKTYGNYDHLYPMPNIITFDNIINNWTNGSTSNNATNRLTYNVGPGQLIINHTNSKFGGHNTVYRYISSDNKTYHLLKESSDPITAICNLRVVILSNLYNPILEKLLIANFLTDFNGIYTYNNNNWKPVTTQLNSLVSNILGSRTAFVTNKITGNLYGSTINGLNNQAVIDYYNNIQPMVTNIQPMNNYVNTAYLFRNYSNIQYIPNIKSSNLYFTFHNCQNLLQVNIETIPDINTNCYYAFYNCNNLTSVLGNMYISNTFGLFNSCHSLYEIPNIHILNNTLKEAFKECYSLENLSSVDFSNVDTIINSFCNGYINTNILNDLDFSKVTTVTGLFSNFRAPNYSIADINIQKISSLNCNNLVDISYLYYYSHNLTSVPNFITTNVKNMSFMLSYCNKLTTIPNYDTSNVLNMCNMLYCCYGITSIPNLNTINVTDMAYMFWNCTGLTAIPNFDTKNVVNMVDMFYNCTAITSTPNFSTNNVRNMVGMYDNCIRLTKTPTLNTINVTNMVYMFYNCYNLTAVSQFNTSNVINMSYMFYNCNKLTTASIQNIINMVLNSNVTNATLKNLNNTNSYSPFYNTNITSSKYSNRTSQLTAAGWTY